MSASLIRQCGLLWLSSFGSLVLSLSADVSSKDGLSIAFSHGEAVTHNTLFVDNSPVHLTPTRTTKSRVRSLATEDGGQIQWDSITPNAVRVNAAYPTATTVSAAFSFLEGDSLYGIWEYPWNGSITNNGQSYADIGVYGDQPGINWANARAPFFFSRSGFGVYVDSASYGTFDFSKGGSVSYTFNASTLSYTVMYNQNLTALLMEYMGHSSKIEMPPESGYGPIFWSDNFEEDFHAGVTNAEENYYDVINHLNSNQIRATAFFADRK